jgi:hypothetical protein
MDEPQRALRSNRKKIAPHPRRAAHTGTRRAAEIGARRAARAGARLRLTLLLLALAPFLTPSLVPSLAFVQALAPLLAPHAPTQPPPARRGAAGSPLCDLFPAGRGSTKIAGSSPLSAARRRWSVSRVDACGSPRRAVRRVRRATDN